MKTLAAVFVLYMASALIQFAQAQETPPPPATDKPVVENLAIPQSGPAAKPEYRHERRQRLREGFSERLEQRFQKIMQHLEKNNPEEYERLMQLRQNDREKFTKEIWQHSPEYSETRKQIAELDKRCWDLAEQYKADNREAERSKIKSQLQALIDESLQLVIKDTKERLEKLQNHLQEMEQEQAKVKEKRLEYFLNNPRFTGRPRPRMDGQPGRPAPNLRENPYSIPVPGKPGKTPPANPEK